MTDGSYVIKPGSEKVLRRASALIPVQEFYGNLLGWFETNVRSLLLKKGKKSVEGMWISSKGNVAGEKLKKLKT